MPRFGRIVAVCLIGIIRGAPDARAQAVVVAVPARAGPVDGTTENSDAFIWRLFTEFTAPVTKGTPSPAMFETWASDDDTFSATPHWPTLGQPLQLRGSILAAAKTLRASQPLSAALLARIIDVPCQPPPGAAVGGFPINGTPVPCIAEQVARNRVQFNYIVDHKLNTKAGLAAAYASSFKVEMPTASVAIKADWIPLQALLQWVPQLSDVAKIRKLYYTATVKNVEYAVIAIHVSSRQNPNWVWGTFEHQMIPGRCDAIGCFDTFGAQNSAIPPNKARINTQYGACPKTQQLLTLMTNAHLSSVWSNYCLKSTEVEYTAADGTPYVLGNSVIEGIVGNGTIAASSCISCHAYASYGPTGTTTATARSILPFNPTGNPIPAVLSGSRTFAFMWGVLQAK